MKKALVLAFLLIFFSLIIYFSFMKRGIEFRRIPLPLSSSFEESFLKENNLKHFQVRGIDYFEFESTSLRGKLLRLEKGVRKISFRPKLKGEYIFHLEILSGLKTNSLVKIYQNSTLLSGKNISSKNTVSIREEIRLAKDDKITLAAAGKGILLIGEPIFFKKKRDGERRLIFLICADTLRADHLQTYGYQRKTSPHIDAFARESVVFKNAYAQAPWTLPSHMSLFTSLYEFNHGVKRGTVISSRINYLVEELSREFSTRSFNGGIYVSSVFGFFRGFDFYHSIPMDQFSPQATKRLFELTTLDLEKNKNPSSFYFLHTYQTHSPYNPPLENLKLFNESPQFTSLSSPTVGSQHRDQYKELPQAMIEAYLDLYDAEIYTFDLGFGEFIEYLKRKNLYENSMIILISDHGEEFFDHSGWGHVHSLYNELIHVPLIIKFPKGKFAGKIVESEVGLIDIMPFVLNYYGLPFERKAVDGIDLSLFLKGKVKKRALISSLTSGFYIPELPFKVATIQRNQKVIYNIPYTEKTFAFFSNPPPPYSEYEFYDLIEDPQERLNLYLQKKYEVRKVIPLFQHVIQAGANNLKMKGEEVVPDQKMIELLKSLGYL